MVTVLQSVEEFKSLIKSDKKTLVMFYSKRSLEAQTLRTLFEDISNQKDTLQFLIVNLDFAFMGEIAQSSAINVIPSFSVYENGHHLHTLVNPSKDKLEVIFHNLE